MGATPSLGGKSKPGGPQPEAERELLSIEIPARGWHTLWGSFGTACDKTDSTFCHGAEKVSPAPSSPLSAAREA
eukprot:6490727-Amphidinium_carterae.3